MLFFTFTVILHFNMQKCNFWTNQLKFFELSMEIRDWVFFLFQALWGFIYNRNSIDQCFKCLFLYAYCQRRHMKEGQTEEITQNRECLNDRLGNALLCFFLYYICVLFIHLCKSHIIAKHEQNCFVSSSVYYCPKKIKQI